MGFIITIIFTMGILFLTPNISSAANGAELYKVNKCKMCHGEAGKADTKMGAKKGIRDMTTAVWQKEFSDDAMITGILKGVKRTRDGKKLKMKAYKKLSADDATALVKLIRSWAEK